MHAWCNESRRRLLASILHRKRGGGIKNKEQFRIDKSRRDGSGGGREIGYGDLLRIFTVRIDLELTAFKCAPSDPSGEFPPGSNCCFSFKLIAVKLWRLAISKLRIIGIIIVLKWNLCRQLQHRQQYDGFIIQDFEDFLDKVAMITNPDQYGTIISLLAKLVYQTMIINRIEFNQIPLKRSRRISSTP